MKSVIIATKNAGKAKDFQKILGPYGVEVKTLLDFPAIDDVEETGETFEENAILKAEAICKKFNEVVIADDSGVVIDALDGRPGVYSARYAGEDKNDEANNDKVLKEMAEVPEKDRGARFYCAIAVAQPGKPTIIVNGTCEGVILFERRGTNGFGYDPIFYVSSMEKSMAELTPEEKNQISHRAVAMKKLETQLTELFKKS
ncbi:XTP/dITP diphosphatase [Niallia sp. XMNu-256]|uniref:XTP/dITP diphosphatase n=1 Tax=Niallia sp. XMNu-256 TaxID=3082444 RepID=UPI0030D39CA2